MDAPRVNGKFMCRRYDASVNRRPFIIGSAMSLLLSVATAVVWVRSYSVNDTLELTIPPHRYEIEAERGQGNRILP